VNARRFTLFVLLYVSLDLSSPFIQGAFSFNPDESTDGVQRRRDPAARRLTTVAAPRDSTLPRQDHLARPANTLVRAPRDGGVVAEWLVDVRRAHAPVPEVSALSDDH
jgi:hypothetical protein